MEGGIEQLVQRRTSETDDAFLDRVHLGIHLLLTPKRAARLREKLLKEDLECPRCALDKLEAKRG